MAKQQKRKLKVVDVDVSFNRSNIIWDRCVICQNKDNQPLISPTEIGYQSLIDNLVEYSQHERLPSHLSLDNLHQNFINNNAKYHKICRTKFNNQKINRLKKKARLNEDGLAEPSSIQTSSTDFRVPYTRDRNTRSVCPKVDIKSVCIFCEEEGKEKLVPASTLGIGPNIVAHAIEIQDDKLLTKLASTDFVALEAKYHKHCYVNFLNKVRSAKRLMKSDVNDNSSRTAYGSVLSELVAYIQDMCIFSSTAPVFRLANLVKLINDRLLELGFPDVDINRTRLKEQLIAFIPGLREDKLGREVTLTFEGDVHNAIQDTCENNSVSDGMCLARAAKILREDMFEEFPEFEGSFKDPFTGVNCVSKKSVMFIRMVLEGPSTGNSLTTEDAMGENRITPLAALSIAQLVRFNSIKRVRKSTVQFTRHLIERETPLPLYIGLMLHSHNGGEQLIDKMSRLGISVSYERVKQVSEAVSSAVCEHYNEPEGTVCPLNVIHNVFTCAAIDNIDHNTSSSTSVDSFYGTTISLILHPPDNTSVPTTLKIKNQKNTSKICLPDWYTSPPPTSKRACEVPLQMVNYAIEDQEITSSQEMKDWLESTGEANGELISWAAFNSRKDSYEVHKEKCTAILLPVLREDINSPSMVRHTMNIIINILIKINSGQTPVLPADQPVYAIAKQIQWMYPDKYGEGKLFVMLGGLHIEMAVISMIGTWLEGSGWTDNLVEASVTTSGRAASILKSSHVKRSRYAHEVTIAAIHILQKEAFNSKDVNRTESFLQWNERRKKESVQFKFWQTTIELEALLLTYIQSIRQGNFPDFVATLQSICSWMFALDHVNYARWLPIFVHNLKQLPDLHPDVYHEFQNGNFAGRKSTRNFSCMAHDQIHEQNNKLVKIDGATLSLLSNENALLRWMTGGPEIARMITEFEEVAHLNYDELNSSVIKHHEDTTSFAKRFQKHVIDLVKVFQTHGNPFEENLLTTVNNNRIVMNEKSQKSVIDADSVGKNQYETYVNDRLILGKTSIHDVIKRNQLTLFSQTKLTRKNKDKQKIVDLRKDSSLFCRLYIASQARDGEVTEFFNYENHPYPPSISEFGKLRKPSAKSDIVFCIEQACTFTSKCSLQPESSALIIDGAALVHMIATGVNRTFQQYSECVVEPYIQNRLKILSRVDVVFDQYLNGSLKAGTRESRGSGNSIAMKPDVRIPKNMKNFLAEDKNKEELFKLLAKNLVTRQTIGKQILCTYKDKAIRSDGEYSLTFVSPSLHEEADGQLLLHTLDAVRSGHKKVTIITVDSDVVVIAISAFARIPDMQELWIEYGTGRHLQYVPIHEIQSKLDRNISDLIPFFHAFTGCDTVSSFCNVGKKRAWKTWLSFREVDYAFREYSNVRQGITITSDSPSIRTLERFVVLMYHSTSTAENVNEARRVLFTQMNRNIENVPPTSDALFQHLKRAIHQCNIWRNCLTSNPPSQDPYDWGWKKTDNAVYIPEWTTIPDMSTHCQELVSCKCKERCTRCRCAKTGLPCTLLCSCEGHCSRSNDL